MVATTVNRYFMHLEPVMPFSLELSSDRKFALLKVTGKYTLQEMEAARRAVVGFCRQEDILSVLVHLADASMDLTISEKFVYMSDHERVLPVGMRIAVLPPKNLEALDFMQNMAANRGIQARVFATEAEALTWLVPTAEQS